jgi:hypothetical protein
VVLKKSMFGKSVSAVLPMFVFAGMGISTVSAYASTISLPDAGNPGADHGSPDNILLFADIEFPRAPANAHMIISTAAGNPEMSHGKPDHVPPVNPPFDTPGRAYAPEIPDVVPDHTFPGSDFGQAVVPVPAAVWLFGSGLLGLAGIARRKKAA